MNLLKKIRERETAVPVTKKTLTSSIFATAVILVVLSAATAAYITTAWFSTNRKVDSVDSNITSEVATTSLFISAGSGAVDNLYNVGIMTEWPNTAKLFPISTSTCSTWWYVSQFTPVWSGNAAKPVATGYTSASVTETNGVATYDNALDGAGKVAYVVSDYKLYTDHNTLDVFLNPDVTNPITVEYSSAKGDRDLLSALRVGVEVNGTLKFIYAPAAETKTGNSSGDQSVGTFYAVSGATTIAANPGNIIKSSLTDFTATASGDPTNPYSAGTATSLGTATTDGIPVRVYVWLEGTDGEALTGIADDDTVGIQVTVNYVGVMPS